ncbi:MAG TPA: MATE family efflux transporter [Gemmatimonadales bacterium]|nr:MATE family efflux transporter [Gemmatimonadales bacterium]
MTEIALERRESWWELVRAALAGTHQDYTSGPIARSLLLLAIPMVLETAMESVFAVVDVFFVSRLGADAVATVGLTESMLVMVYTVAIGLSIGLSAVVARRIGEKDGPGAARAAVQGVALGLGVAAAVGAIGIVFAPQLLALMGASPAVQAAGAGYTRVMLAGSGTVLLLFLINAVFRGAGDATIAMRSLWLANGINIVLDPCLIFGLGPFPEMGLTGAAVATTIGRGTGVLYQLTQLCRRDGRVLIRRAHLRLDPEAMATVVRLSGVATFQVLIATTSYIGLVRVVSSFGSEVLAGYTIAIRLLMFVLLPSWGLSNAAATMVGQALGAEKPERAARAVGLAGIYNVVLLGLVSVVFLVFARGIVSAFSTDPPVLAEGVLALRTIAVGLAFYGYGMVLHQSFNGAGDTWTPTYLNLLCFWALQIPLAWVLSRRVGAWGAYLAMPLAECTLTVLSAWMFGRGRWKTRRV